METIFQSIEILSKEKGIDPQIVFDAVKDAMLIAARKHYRTNEDYVAEMDPKTGAIHLFAVKKAVEVVEDPVHEMTLAEARRIQPDAEIGSEIRITKNTDQLGRISAQTAKQVILQKVREAERETVYNEYSGRAGELVNCTVKRVEGPEYVLDLGKTEAKLAKKEQSRLESYSVGDRVRCVIRLVDKASKGPGVLVSRAAPELVMRLFEQEVPEIYDGTVSIKGCAREAGERTKIAVQSRDRDVDSVGALGFELLLRWRHPDKGMISPADFIPVAEDIGLIVSLGEWVLREACMEAAKWPDDVKVAVNLSPVQFRSRNLVQVVISALAQSGLSPKRLELEITETAVPGGDGSEFRDPASAARARRAHFDGRFRHRLFQPELPAKLFRSTRSRSTVRSSRISPATGLRRDRAGDLRPRPQPQRHHHGGRRGDHRPARLAARRGL